MTQGEENQLATSLGFVCEPDERRGHGLCKFNKGSWTIWQCVRNGRIVWAAAKLIYGSTDRPEVANWTSHTYHAELKDALSQAETSL
jgi:hypothetical protein